MNTVKFDLGKVVSSSVNSVTLGMYDAGGKNFIPADRVASILPGNQAAALMASMNEATNTSKSPTATVAAVEKDKGRRDPS